jgi:hypothetical protein
MADDAGPFEKRRDPHPKVRGNAGEHMDKGEPDGAAVIHARETNRPAAGRKRR